MDMIMPDTDGIETISKLMEESADAKIIAMTGAVGDQNFLDVAKQCGVRHMFAKPFDLDAMVSAVHEELARKPSPAPASQSRKKVASFFGVF
jgi:two-component system response regulator (stage 0 sporulation protein F)